MQQVYETTGKMPKTLAIRPFVRWPLDTYLYAYFKLGKRRQSGMTANPLQYSEMKAYAEIHHFAGDMEFFVRVISELDDHALEHFSKKREQDDAADKAKHEKEVAAQKESRKMRRP